MFICEYDYTMQPLDRDNITSYAQEIFPRNREISEEHYQQCLSTAVDNGQYATTNQSSANVHAFLLNDIKYFCIVLNPGLNAEQWYYGKISWIDANVF
jgi:hypothetical protein